METRRLGRTDLDVSVLCLGTMMFGEQVGEADAVAQMDYALGQGINFFDTAELYTIPPKPETWGESERILGRWAASRGVRDKIVIATKVTGRSSMTWQRATAREVRLTREQIIEAVEGSLKRLQTDYIDLYQIHWPDRKVPLFGRDLHGYFHYENDYEPFESILSVFGELRDQGKIRHFGLSNETPWGAMRFLRESERLGLPRMQSIQNAYNLLNRYFEYGLAEIALNEEMGLLAYSPLAQGYLTGKYLAGEAPAGTRKALFGDRLGRYETPSAAAAIEAYLDIARKFDLDPAQLALQFVTTRPWVTSNIIGASTLDQLKSDIASTELTWASDLEDAINAVHARLPNPCP
ncbi:MAG: aldo/keto reductase [Parvularculaceae bacterium]